MALVRRIQLIFAIIKNVAINLAQAELAIDAFQGHECVQPQCFTQNQTSPCRR